MRWLLILLLTVPACGSSKGAPGSPPAAAPTAREGTVTMDDGVTIHYRAIGDQGPAVVIPITVFMSPHFDGLADDHRVVYYDPRGRGASDTGDLAALSLSRNIADLEALRAELGFEQMALIGMSGLGMEMAAYALEHPTRVSHLVQLAPVPPRQSPHMDGRWDGMMKRIDPAAMKAYEEAIAAGAPAAEQCELFNRALAPSYSAQPDRIDIAAICRHPNEHPDHQGKVWEAFGPSILELDFRPRVAELTMPRLVIWGERDLIPLEGVEEWIVEGAPVELLTVPGADHVPHIDRPDVVLPAIETFLSR
jgi:proline iminopeptidase